jgi:hypothetical protein
VQISYFTQADRWARRAVALDPRNPRIHWLYAEQLYHWWQAQGGKDKSSKTYMEAAKQLEIGKRLDAGPKHPAV